MRERDLPTRDEVFQRAQTELSNAYKALGDAADWLRSDWQPLGTPLTDQQKSQRRRMFDAIDRAKNAINRAR